jgi:hypothetical protein
MHGCSDELKPDTGRSIMAAELLALSAMGVVTLGYRIYRRQEKKNALLNRLAAYSMMT